MLAELNCQVPKVNDVDMSYCHGNGNADEL